ncbi:UNVERIFIED_CONTAM: hypothetical protein Sindi_1267400 [Sesamum indicum]
MDTKNGKHARSSSHGLKNVGIFQAASNKMHAVHLAIYVVNKAFTPRITYSWGYSRFDKLRERFYTFQWVENHPGVVWNHDERKLTIEDGMWDQICKEKKLARCNINAYEPLWDELCELFDDDENKTIWINDDEEDADDQLGANPGWADPPCNELVTVIFYSVCVHVSDSSDDSSALGALFKDLYDSDTEADSAYQILPRTTAEARQNPRRRMSHQMKADDACVYVCFFPFFV